jgi:micrococcal nuclease
MKRALFGFSALVSIFLLLSLGHLQAERLKITRVYDGDTIRAEGSGVVIYVMLLGIDAPEAVSPSREGQPFGQEARKFLSDLILGQFVEVEGYGTGPYPDDKILGVIFLDGKNVNLEMVRHGFAEVYRENLPAGFDLASFLSAEQEARNRRVGIWSQGDDYMSPTEWRRLRHRKP